MKQVGFIQPTPDASDWQQCLRESWRQYFVATLGLPLELAEERARIEISEEYARQYCDYFESNGITFAGKRFLDIGCGHGTLAIHLARRGAIVYAAEPCDAWRQVAEIRAKQMEKAQRPTFVNQAAEQLDFPDGSFDYIISLQVLEHVIDPSAALAEVKRLLRSDGTAFVSCENYLAFREQHYRVPWFPLFPKFLAQHYLRLIGRNPKFLLEHVTYTIYPGLICSCLKRGLWSTTWPLFLKNWPKPLALVLLTVLHRRNLFRVGFSHFLRHN